MQLRNQHEQGWPANRTNCPKELLPYWAHQSDITIVNDLMLFQDRIIIPRNMRKDILHKIHEGHLGIEKCKRRARQSVFWPGITTQIEQLVQRCDTCMALQPSKKKELLIPHEVPTRPWQKLGTDLFQYGNNQFLIIVDYFSLWPEVFKLSPATSQNVIIACKDSFARHGIPEVVISDNGSQYTARSFKRFSKEWQFVHKTSSPYHPQSNGLAEATVKTIKRLLKKCSQTKQDVLKGLLILRNTPLAGGKSPSELLNGRQLRDNLPTVPSPTEIRSQNYTKRTQEMTQQRLQQKQYHDRTASISNNSNKFSTGQLVAIQDANTKEWRQRGRITKVVAPRSFELKLVNNGRIVRRNQRFLRKVFVISTSCADKSRVSGVIMHEDGERDDLGSGSEHSEDTTPYEEEGTEENGSECSEETIPYDEQDEEEATIERSRYGRLLKKKRYDNYVLT